MSLDRMRSILRYWAATIFLTFRRLLVLALVAGSGWLVYILFVSSLTGERSYVIGFLGIWLLLAYILLPWLHRIMTKLYVPDYYVGRARTRDGLLADPVNLAFIGSKRELKRAMEKAGWFAADDLTPHTAWRMMVSTIFRRSYPNAPVSRLYLFGDGHSFAFQQEVAGNPHKRHHVRFWKSPRGWVMPGGYKVDWLAAGTFDRAVGLSLFTLQVTHRIAENTDEERDYIVQTLKQSGATKRVRIIKDYSTGYHHRSGGGDSIITDGALPILNL